MKSLPKDLRRAFSLEFYLSSHREVDMQGEL